MKHITLILKPITVKYPRMLVRTSCDYQKTLSATRTWAPSQTKGKVHTQPRISSQWQKTKCVSCYVTRAFIKQVANLKYDVLRNKQTTSLQCLHHSSRPPLHKKLPSEWIEVNLVQIFKKGEKFKAANYMPVSFRVVTCKSI